MTSISSFNLKLHLNFLQVGLSINRPTSVGKRSHHVMDTVNAKKRWTVLPIVLSLLLLSYLYVIFCFISEKV
jgi:hypothetical protein